MSKIDTLPRCKHDNCLCDWSGEWLAPPCGCNFDNVSEDIKKQMAILKLGLEAKTKKMELTTKEERSLLLYLETCAVDKSGLVDPRHMNEEDMNIAEKWNAEGFVRFGRRAARDIQAAQDSGQSRPITYWCTLSNEAWAIAAKERRERAERVLSKRIWVKAREENAS